MRKADPLEQLRTHDEVALQKDFITMVNSAAEGAPESTFLHYGEPRVIAAQDRKGVFHPKYHKEEDDLKQLFEAESVYKETRGRLGTDDCSKKIVNFQEIRKILNNVFPPQVWRDEGKIFRRSVSMHSASRAEIVKLQDKLDAAIKEHGLKATGLSTKRRQIFDQCFDELTRQEIISCHPRGLLLLRIRDELRSSLQAYESLYLSNAAYGVRKAARVAAENEKLEKEMGSLLDERQTLHRNIHGIREQLFQQGEKFRHITAQSRRFFNEERENLKRHNQTLKMQLEAMVSGGRDSVTK